jgi:aspartate/glutamate racemase
MEHSAQTVHLSCTEINIISKQTETSAQNDFHAVVHLSQIVHLSSDHQIDLNDLPLDPRHLGVPSGVTKMIFMLVVPSAQTVHLSCAEINTLSKWIEMSIHLIHVT